MRVPSQPRRASARRKPVHFEYVNTKATENWHAWIAGPTWWGWLHPLRPSKPCVYELTGGHVACRFCAGKTVPAMKGWVPLYRCSDDAAVMVPVDEVQRDAIDAITTYTRVVVGRNRNKGASVFVKPSTDQSQLFSSTLPERQNPADVTDSLLTVWALPEVTAFFVCDRTSDNAVTLPTGTAVTESGEAFSPMMQAAAKRVGAEVMPDEDGSKVVADRNRLRALQYGAAATNGNGKHKAKPKG